MVGPVMPGNASAAFAHYLTGSHVKVLSLFLNYLIAFFGFPSPPPLP